MSLVSFMLCMFTPHAMEEPRIPVNELTVLLLLIVSVIFAEIVITHNTDLYQETQIQNTKPLR